MKITVIIAEYNPYHNGHDFQKNLIKQGSNSQFAVAVMSGNFTQRGEPAIFDKWTRAHLALLSGIDIVIELPAIYVLQSAEGFASGGVAIANALCAVNELCFGSESADAHALKNVAQTLASEGREYREKLKTSLSEGFSFPVARKQALNDMDIPDAPNDILAVEYLKALIRSESSIAPRIIKRVGPGYHDTNITGSLASASAIRNAISNGEMAGVYQNIPEVCHSFLKEHLKKSKPVFAEDFFDLMLYRLRTMGAGQIARIYGVQEGLENKILKAAASADSLSFLIAAIKSKRYTQTRISRILISSLLGITAQTVQEANTYQGLYARVLGYRKTALPALSLLSEKSRIPVITRGTQLPDNAISRLDILASDIYALACNDKTAGRDFTEKIIVV